MATSREERDPKLVPRLDTLHAAGPSASTTPSRPGAEHPTLRSALPSMVPADEDPEDTLAAALLPLQNAELGLDLPPDTARMGLSQVPAAATLPPGFTLPPPTVRMAIPPAGEVLVFDPESSAATAQTDPAPPPVGLEACLSEAGIAMIETDPEGMVVALNTVAEHLTGWPSADAIGAPISSVFRDRPRAGDDPYAELSMPPEHTAILERRDGRLLPIRHVSGLGPRRAGELSATTGRIIVFRDVSGRQLLTLHLARLARHDPLTGLLNRHALTERVEQALAESKSRGVRHILCYFNLDRFRLVNTSCGHDAGDDLLRWVATRVHEFVGPLDAAGRVGSDEFALLLVGRDTREGEWIARELQRRLLEFRFGFQDKTFTVGASFGLVPFGAEFSRAPEVLITGDQMSRLAKEAGRGRLHVFLPDDDKTAQSRRSIEWLAGLKRNLEEGRLRLFAQKIQPLAMKEPVGAHFEVLMRLVDYDGRLQSPVGVIQAAENGGMMDALDRFVVRQAFRAIGALPLRAMRRLETCAINLSAVSLMREGLLDYIVQEMQRANVPPSKVAFEITESAALANLGELLWLMQELGAMGCRFAIDDFGSGHASYGYIENLPVDYVKIDGMFVRDLPDNALHRAIVESVHRIGCTLGIHTIAEAVETQAIADTLREIGVHYAQGWLFGYPQPISDVFAELALP